MINVSSEAHNLAPSGGINFEDLQLKDAWFAEWRRYGQSKVPSLPLSFLISFLSSSSPSLRLSLLPRDSDIERPMNDS